MKKIFVAMIVSCAFIISGSLANASAPPPSPPSIPASGYGSPAKYICNSLYNGGSIDHHHCIDFGDTDAGERCWVYIPSVLKNGTSAPVVIYLHGMFALVPPIYAPQIRHLVRQGYIVIFPEYNKGGFDGMFNDSNQYEQLGRAIDAVDAALDLPAVASRADMGSIYIASHSNGGNLSMGWVDNGGVPVQGLIMQHPCISNEAIPAFVRTLFLGDMIEIDAPAHGPAITCPVVVVGGVDDTVAKPVQLNLIMNSLPNAASKVQYMYDSDDHGDPALEADHVVPCQNDGILPAWLLDLMGSMGFSAFEEDSDDYRIHFAAVDAVLDGKTRVPFDRGAWSDGRAVNPVVKVYDPDVTGVMLYQDCDYNAGTRGYAVQLTQGSYNLGGLKARGFSNDSLSSIKIPAGWKVTLYKDDNFKGATKVLYGNNSCLVGIGFNDVVSSIKVE